MEVDLETREDQVVSCELVRSSSTNYSYLLTLNPNLYLHFGLIDPDNSGIVKACIYFQPTEVQFVRTAGYSKAITEKDLARMRSTFREIKSISIATDARLYYRNFGNNSQFFDDSIEYSGAILKEFSYEHNSTTVRRADYQNRPLSCRLFDKDSSDKRPIKDEHTTIIHIPVAVQFNITLLEQFKSVPDQVILPFFPYFTSYVYVATSSSDGSVQRKMLNATTTFFHTDENGNEKMLPANLSELVIEYQDQFFTVAPTRLIPFDQTKLSRGYMTKFDLDSKDKCSFIRNVIRGHDTSPSEIQSMISRVRVLEHKVFHHTAHHAEYGMIILHAVKIELDERFYCTFRLKRDESKNNTERYLQETNILSVPLFEVDQDDRIDRLLACSYIYEALAYRSLDKTFEEVIKQIRKWKFFMKDGTEPDQSRRIIELAFEAGDIRQRSSRLFESIQAKLDAFSD